MRPNHATVCLVLGLQALDRPGPPVRGPSGEPDAPMCRPRGRDATCAGTETKGQSREHLSSLTAGPTSTCRAHATRHLLRQRQRAYDWHAWQVQAGRQPGTQIPTNHMDQASLSPAPHHPPPATSLYIILFICKIRRQKKNTARRKTSQANSLIRLDPASKTGLVAPKI